MDSSIASAVGLYFCDIALVQLKSSFLSCPRSRQGFRSKFRFFTTTTGLGLGVETRSPVFLGLFTSQSLHLGTLSLNFNSICAHHDKCLHAP